MTAQDDMVSLLDAGTWSNPATKPTVLETSQDGGGVGQYIKRPQSAIIVRNFSLQG